MARDSLGVFENWAAFRDPSVPRCYAIAAPAARRQPSIGASYATVATWPRRSVRGQVHFRLSREMRTGGTATLAVGNVRFRLTGRARDVWARDRAMDAAIVAAMRSASTMAVRATDARGRRFTDGYELAGAATAMDAATVGCARQ